MQVDIITTIEGFNRLKENWDQIFQVDRDSTVQRSWGWMKGWIESTDLDWFILAARDENTSDYVGFVVLSSRMNRHCCSLELGGRPWAARTGFICHPDYQGKVLKSFAWYTRKKLNWDEFNLRDVHDEKIEEFLREFSTGKYKIIQKQDTPCPQLELTRDWETYTQNYLSKSKNKKLGYYLRRVEKELDYRIIQANGGDLDRDSDVLLEIWQRRFGQRDVKELRQIKKLWEICYQQKQFWYELIYDGEVVVAGLAAYMDDIKGRISPFIIVHNEDYSKYSLGKVIVAHSLKYAIGLNYKVYDFGRGDSEYKSWFGATGSSNKNYLITKRNYAALLKSLPGKLLTVIR